MFNSETKLIYLLLVFLYLVKKKHHIHKKMIAIEQFEKFHRTKNIIGFSIQNYERTKRVKFLSINKKILNNGQIKFKYNKKIQHQVLTNERKSYYELTH